jgi:hypothetical protein
MLAFATGWGALAGWSCVGDIGGDGGGIEGPDVEALCAAGNLPGPHPRVVRLTHAQFDHTVSDHLKTGLYINMGDPNNTHSTAAPHNKLLTTLANAVGV